MNRKIYAVLCMAAFLSGVSAWCQPTCALAWTHGMNDHPEWCEKFRQAGFDSLCIGLPKNTRESFWWRDSSSLDSIHPLLQEAKSAGLRSYIQIPMGMMTGTKFGSRTVTAAGFEEPLLACPLNENFWSEFLVPAVSAIARLSLEFPGLRGVILDTEQYYGKERSGAINEHYCFCDECFGGFLKSLKIQGPMPARNGRLPWLEARGQLADYWKNLEHRVQKRAEHLEAAVQAIAPKFEIHFYIFEDTWFYRGLLRGLASSGHTVFVFDGKTYNGFLKIWAEEAKAALAALNPRAVWVPGFYTETLNPRALRINIRKAKETDGSYWVYNTRIPFPFRSMEN